jgi:hypothetical protein
MMSVTEKPPTSISLGKVMENDKKAKNYSPPTIRHFLATCLTIIDDNISIAILIKQTKFFLL